MPAGHPNRQAIRAGQLEVLRNLLGAVLPANPFQTRKLSDSGLTAKLGSLAEFAAKAPFTLKTELAADQLAHPPYGTNLTYPVARYTRLHQTSGTSGQPMPWLDTEASWDWMVRSWTEVFWAAGVTAQDRVFFAFSFGPFIGFWLAFDAAERMGALCLPGGGLSSAARLQMLMTHGATVICCTPTYALRLAEVARAEGMDLRAGKVRTLILAGEPGASIPATRQQLESLWPGARMFDHHGMTEVGPVTYECPAQPGVLHVIESAYLAEVVHPETGLAVAAGETGELVLTTLGRTGSPLLRYRTGDLVKPRFAPEFEVIDSCACGRQELALDGGILGRVDDMVVVRGVNVFPGAVEELIRSVGGVAEYRVTVTEERAMAELQVEIEPLPVEVNAEELAGRVAKAFHDTFALRVPVKVVSVGTLPRFELKARRWRRVDGPQS